jgi:hypothetical protein
MSSDPTHIIMATAESIRRTGRRSPGGAGGWNSRSLRSGLGAGDGDAAVRCRASRDVSVVRRWGRLYCRRNEQKIALEVLSHFAFSSRVLLEVR